MVLDRPVRTVMQDTVHTVDVDTPLSDVQRLLDAGAFHHVPVLESQRLVGIVSSIDLARLSLEPWVADAPTRTAWLDKTMSVRQAMSPLPEVLHPEEPIRKAAELLGDGTYHALPVVDRQGHLVGIVTSTDLIRLLHDEAR